MFWLWLIVAILIIAIGSYVVGALDWDEDQKLNLLWCIAIGSFVWPVVLAFVIVVGPFAGLFWLGDRAREKKKAAAKADEQK
jgi:chromate transport protein ChrA